MSNKAIYIRELPTLDFIMREINEQKTPTDADENERIGKLCYWLAASQILQIAVGTVLSFFVAPASLFVSRTENEAVGWIAAAFAGVVMIALGLILIVLSTIAAVAFRNDKKWRNVVGFATSGLAILAFPFGTILGGYLIWKIINLKKAERALRLR